MRLAIVYDRFNKIGGAERVLQVLFEIWPQANFFTSVYHPHKAPFAKTWQVTTSFLQHFPFALSHHELYPWLTPFAFESFSLDDFDVVISVTSAEAKGVITKPETLHLCYCLTPTRYLWSHASQYHRQGNFLLKPIKNLILTKLRIWDQIAASRPDHYLAISQTVKQRIKKYYRRSSQVIYPPVDTNFFKPGATGNRLPIADYFLIVSRLVAYKHIDIAIKACNDLGLHLVIVGTGAQKKSLQKISGKTITFTGKLTDQKLVSYYQSCTALIFPGEEDFGLTILEAQSMGKPVIALSRGGATEIVKQGKTGLFFDTLSVSALKQVLTSLKTYKLSSTKIRQHAQTFNQEKFKTTFKGAVDTLWQKHQQHSQ